MYLKQLAKIPLLETYNYLYYFINQRKVPAPEEAPDDGVRAATEFFVRTDGVIFLDKLRWEIMMQMNNVYKMNFEFVKVSEAMCCPSPTWIYNLKSGEATLIRTIPNTQELIYATFNASSGIVRVYRGAPSQDILDDPDFFIVNDKDAVEYVGPMADLIANNPEIQHLATARSKQCVLYGPWLLQFYENIDSVERDKRIRTNILNHLHHWDKERLAVVYLDFSGDSTCDLLSKASIDRIFTGILENSGDRKLAVIGHDDPETQFIIKQIYATVPGLMPAWLT